MLMEVWHCLSLSENSFFREPGLDMGLDMGLEVTRVGKDGSRAFGGKGEFEGSEVTGLDTAVSDMAGSISVCLFSF